MRSKHVCAFLSVSLIALANAAGQATFIPLGDLPGGAFSSAAYGVSANGKYVVGAGTISDIRQSDGTTQNTGRGFVWSLGTGMVQLDALTGANLPTSIANAVSNTGLIVGESTDATTSRAVTWNVGSTAITDLNVQLTGATAQGVSRDGGTIIGFGDSQQTNAFYEGFKKIGSDPDFVLNDISGGDIFATPYAVSGDGNVTVASGSSDFDAGEVAIYWEGTDVDPFDLPDINTGASDLEYYGFAQGVNNDGSVIVGQGSPGISFFALNREAVKWTKGAGGLYTVERLGGKVSTGYGVTDDGNTVVGRGRLVGASTPVEAIIWRNSAPTKFQLLKSVLVSEYGVANLTGWTLKRANAISADGKVIVGEGTNPSGQTEAWAVIFGNICQADFNGDGFLDFTDFDDFVTAFEAGLSSSDFNGDGFLDFTDFDDFVAAFEAGC
ncbi:MAG: GC-type dockerin domain-anchored protein [Planctomycetota bacterium]|nr:GC-type dockerin domain-anchored protein [Planctomycetota bacterium]